MIDAPRKEFPDRPWTILEVADYLQVSERTVRSRINDSDMPHRYIGGALRFIRSEVDAWVARQPGKNGAADAGVEEVA